MERKDKDQKTSMDGPHPETTSRYTCQTSRCGEIETSKETSRWPEVKLDQSRQQGLIYEPESIRQHSIRQSGVRALESVMG